MNHLTTFSLNVSLVSEKAGLLVIFLLFKLNFGYPLLGTTQGEML